MTYGYHSYGSSWGSSSSYCGSYSGYGSGYGGHGSSYGGSKGGWGGSKDYSWGGSKDYGWGGSDYCGSKGGYGGSKEYGWGGSKGGYGGSKDHSWGGSKDWGWGGSKGGCAPDDTPPSGGVEIGEEGASCHFTISSGGVTLIVTVTEMGDNALKFDIAVADDSARIGDLRGIFFNVDDSVEGDLFVYSGDDVTDSKFGHGSVNDLGNGVNVKGPGGGYDVGVEFGTSGIGKDDIRSTSFILANGSGTLSLADLANQDVAARLTSVGEEGGSREDSIKIVGETGDLDCDTFNNESSPVPFDDAGMVCAGETTTIDVLANDTDPGETDFGPEDNWGLTLTAVYDANDVPVNLVEGEWITLASGARVTLSGDQLVYDSAGAFDDLLVGTTTTDTFTYAVIDSDGAPGFADVTVTIGGNLNLVDTIGNADPALVTMDIDQVISSITGRLTNIVTLDFSGALDGLDGVYTHAYCVDRTTPANLLLTGAQVYDSTDPGSLPAGLVDKPDMLDEVNWVLNQDFESTYSLTDVQSAIWALIDDAGGVDVLPRQAGVQLSAGAQAIYTEALLHDGFVVDQHNPDADVKGMIFLPVDSAGEENGQAFIIGFDLESCEDYMM
ncbi:hypothetical protein P2H44_17025 [Albimonas sp. CAU 1670]|uniref:hypothetical protein n=1 Tax=Albimonas sp. CAU 1670 TaxID=3032599 RepID=UPI0023DAE6DE|nr:hypothetical protein [Albimonas sp. CAU 1670]MDF2234266.1 hypothetical protein [Albimonas sp. CAU 1670]